MDHDHNDDAKDWKAAAQTVPELRWLKMLVTGMGLIMGLGMIALVALLWFRLGQPMLPELPDKIALPDGATPQAVTFARDFIVVVTEEAGEVLLFDRSGVLHKRIQP